MAAAKGKGRGKGISFNVEALGFGRGEVLPSAVLQPPPLFPQVVYKPVDLEQGEEIEYLVALKQEFRGTIRKSSYFIKAEETKKDIDRYSDKYQQSKSNSSSWTPDWNRFPYELRYDRKRPVRKSLKVPVNTKLKKARPIRNDGLILADDEIIKVPSDKKDEEDDDENEEEKEEGKEDKEGDAEDEDEFYDDSEVEEETDYISSYFDNGENYGEDDDDGEEGPTY